MLTGQELEKGMSMLKIIWAALAMSLIMYVFAVPLLLRDTFIDFPPEAYGELRLAMYGIALATIVVTWYMRRLMLKSAPKPTKSRQHPALQRYTSAMIFALAMTETIGLFGLILYLLGKNHTDLYLLTALAAATMTLYFPRKEEVIDLAEKFARRG